MIERLEIVLVVDDDPAVRRSVNRVLRRAGFRHVVEAQDGSEAIHLAQTSHPHFVILDAEMPYLSGAAAAPAIRQHAPDAYIVAFSGKLTSTPPWADAYLSKGASMVLPAFMDVVVSADSVNIEQIIGRRSDR